MNKWVVVVTLAAIAGLIAWRVLLQNAAPTQEEQFSVSLQEGVEPSQVVRELHRTPPAPQRPTIAAMEQYPERPSEPAPEVVEEVTAEAVLLQAPMELENSDSGFRQVAEELSPMLVKWLLPDQQLRKWVLAVDLIADGKLPKRYRPLDFSMPSFAVTPLNLHWQASESNYSRADKLIDALVAIDQQRLMVYYRELYPLLEKAYAEQGKPGTFHQRLAMAIDQVLIAQSLPSNTILHRPHVLYQYADQNLEQRNDIEKLLWRLGDNNRERLQAWLQGIKKAL